MMTKDTDIVSLFEQALSQKNQEEIQEVGIVIKVADGVCKVYGLMNAVFGELIQFQGGACGMVLDLDDDIVSVILLDDVTSIAEQQIAKRTGTVFSVPSGEAMLGRVISATGKVLDALGDIKTTSFSPIERTIPGIIDRSSINQSLETGIVAIDALIPIGRGQRELIIGNRSTGKTSMALDTILHQKDQNVLCIYVAIGHKQATTARIIYELEKNGALEYSVVIDASAEQPALNQYLAPYTGCTIGEYFMSRGRDVLIVYDNLSNHAIAYRELSLLLRRPPGREAYPGDIFYIHSRLLERAGKLSAALGGGSLTALPVIQTQGDDISAYIPTNLISITDGQIFLDTQLFNKGVRPAVNISLSVSRVGGAAQTKAVKNVAGSLKLELAQYNELLAFEQFGSELDKASQRALDRGRRAIEILKQPEREGHSFADQAIFLFLLKENYLDKLALHDVRPYIVAFVSYFKATYPQAYQALLAEKDFSDEIIADLKQGIEEYALIFSPTQAPL